jgi:hypothetical protein
MLVVRLMDGFPSSQSQITEGTIRAYVEAVEDCGVSALALAVKQFCAGKVKGHNPAFLPPSAALAQEARRIEQQFQVEEFWKKNEFIEVDTPEWLALCRWRNKSMPTVDRGSKLGWYVSKDEMAEVPQSLVDLYRKPELSGPPGVVVRLAAAWKMPK